MTSLFRSSTIVLTAGIVLTACTSDKPKAEVPPPATPAAAVVPTPPAQPTTQAIESITYAPALAVDLSKMKKDSLGIYTRDLVVGKGPAVTGGETIAMNYTGWTNDGNKFDSSEGKAPYQLVLGGHQVINGWDVGIVGMKVGGKRQLIIPSSQGYGPAGMPPIPGGAVLIFNVELVSAKK